MQDSPMVVVSEDDVKFTTRFRENIKNFLCEIGSAFRSSRCSCS